LKLEKIDPLLHQSEPLQTSVRFG